MHRHALFALLSLLLAWNAAAATYTDRATFDAMLASSVTDTYENPAYGTQAINILSDQAMSAVVGETGYSTSTFGNWNFILDKDGNHYYCSGCNGNFVLDFTATSVGTAAGVYAVGFDVLTTSGLNAFVLYGDGSMGKWSIATTSGVTTVFYGLTSERLIASIFFVGLTATPSSAIDNLTLGSSAGLADPGTPNPSPVPEPGTWAMLLLGLVVLAATARRCAA